MKTLKALAAAAALVAAGSSHALVTYSTDAKGSELVFVIYSANLEGSYSLDLGVQMQDFLVAQNLAAGYTRTWTVNDAYFAKALTGIANFGSNARWGVVSSDTTGSPTTPGDMRMLTTVNNGFAGSIGWPNTNFRTANGNFDTFVDGMNATGITNAGDDLEGNHSDVANGANWVINGKGAFYGLDGSDGPNHTNAPFTMGNSVGATTFFSLITPSGTPNLNPVQRSFVGNGNQGTWNFALDTASGQYLLTYNVNAVPEPGTYALLAAGLGFVGFVVRRRTAR